MVIKRKPAFATAAIFLILMTITFALASQLNRQNSYFKNLPNIIGQRHQLEFKKGIENKFLNSKKDFNKSEIKTDFNLVELQSQGLFNLSQIINGQGSQNIYFDANLLTPAAEVIKGCSNGFANLKDIKFILRSFVTAKKSIPIMAFEPYSKLNSDILLDLSRCIRISPKISKTNLTFSPPRVLSLIFNIEASKAALVSELLRKNEINNFDELISFLKQGNYDYRSGLKWYDFHFGSEQITRSIALEKNGDIFYMADIFDLGNTHEVLTWSDLQWLPGS